MVFFSPYLVALRWWFDTGCFERFIELSRQLRAITGDDAAHHFIAHFLAVDQQGRGTGQIKLLGECPVPGDFVGDFRAGQVGRVLLGIDADRTSILGKYRVTVAGGCA